MVYKGISRGLIKKRLALSVGNTILQTETSAEAAFICLLAYPDVNEQPHSTQVTPTTTPSLPDRLSIWEPTSMLLLRYFGQVSGQEENN